MDRDDLGPLVERQIEYALATADLILWLVDSKEGVTPLDELVARRMRGIKKPVVLVANKTEGRDAAWAVGEFHKLGAAREPIAISAQNGEGVEELYDEILAHFDEEGDEASDEVPPVKTMMRLAVVGQRNAGKSSFINALAQEDRMIVSEVPGTTRDSVDVVFERDGQSFVAIDTAGVRRKKSMQDAIEFYADSRSHRSVRRVVVPVRRPRRWLLQHARRGLARRFGERAHRARLVASHGAGARAQRLPGRLGRQPLDAQGSLGLARVAGALQGRRLSRAGAHRMDARRGASGALERARARPSPAQRELVQAA